MQQNVSEVCFIKEVLLRQDEEVDSIIPVIID